MSALIQQLMSYGGSSDTFTTFSPNFQNSSLILSNGNLTVTHDAGTTQHRCVGSVDAKSTGVWYFEVTANEVGATAGGFGVGAGSWNQGLNVHVGGTSSYAVGFLTGNSVYINGSFSGNGAGSMATGDVISVEVDADTRKVRFRINGGSWSSQFTVPDTQPIAPLVSLYNNNAQATVNFGATPFAYTATGASWTSNNQSGRYFRSFQVANSNTNAAIAEIALRESPGGSDVVGSGTPSASSVFSSPTYDAEKAVDGNVSTMWHSGSGQGSNSWWQYDFGSGVQKAIVQSLYTVRNDSLLYPTNLRFLYSNDNSLFFPLYAAEDLVFTQGEAKTFTFT